MSLTTSKREKKPDNTIEFPVLMVHCKTGDVWLMQAPSQGTLLQSSHDGIIGGNSVHLEIPMMRKFHGQLTLKQD